MKMLREWNGDSQELIIENLKAFGVNAKRISLTKYVALSPDSFIWYFYTDKESGSNLYCLYAEDYIPGLEHVLRSMHDNCSDWESGVKFKLVKVSKQGTWDKASPVKSATTYQPPKDPGEFMKYAATSGLDFVFLGQATDNQ